LLSQKQAGFLQKQLDSYKSLLRVVEIQLQAGVAKKSDLDRLQVNKTNIETELEYVKNLSEEQISNLKLLSGLAGDEKVAILDSLSEATIFSEPKELFDVKNRVDWQILQSQEDAEHFVIRQEQAGYAPVLALTAQANKDFYDNQFKPFTDAWYNSSFVALSLDFPIFDGLKKRAQIAQSRIEFNKIRNRKSLLLFSASLEIQDAQNKLNYSGSRLQSQKTNQELAMEVYRETTVQYNGGTASLSDLLNAESSLLESQRQYLQALADKILAEFAIQKAKGILLQSLNIE
jgi:outer membrane protein TolC